MLQLEKNMAYGYIYVSRPTDGIAAYFLRIYINELLLKQHFEELKSLLF